ncbi:EamA family transporter [Haladaptatus sp. F3-133]|jgi:transporter family protein|uniref:EamA family transporter n=1 Tax=Halorutilus salinus TaxID=2487751 RepID=A0A9Q4GH40_9EURY|nr:EamA family transporter [Halorutilus salinus]MCX2818405.1 EamA family transporter [Halorutilus salinus]
MNYVVYAVIALLAYSLVPPLVDLATREIPSSTAALMSNTVLVVVAAGVVAYTGEWDTSYLTGRSAVYIYAAGVCLAVGILAYYRALAEGPVSVVVPIFGLFLAASSVLGVVFFEETVTTRKVVGITLALVSVYLISTS